MCIPPFLVPPIVLFSLLVAAPAHANGERVVATLPPVALIVGALTGETPATLSNNDGGHEHGGSLRPSDAALLGDADLVLWVGGGLEPGVAAALRSGVPAVALAEVDGVPERDGPGDTPDPHAWLDPAGMAAMVRAAANALVELHPGETNALAARRDGLLADLADADARIAARMAPLVERPFAVEHDAFRHFAGAFGLATPLAFGEGAVGARTLRAARREVAERGITCLIVEPGEPSRLAAALGDDVRAVTIDPLGRDADSPVALLESVAAGFEDCLGR